MIQSGDHLKHYRLEQRLGRGGFSEVFLATDTYLDIEVAVKVLLPQHSRNDDFVRRFQLGASAAARLNHPNIVRVLYMDALPKQNIYFNVMELLNGGTLLDRIWERRLSFQTAKNDFVQIADAIGYAHDNGYIHRDIKPANILYSTTNKPFVTDFDLSRVLGETRMTEPGMAMGTVHYMAPEQAQGEDVTPATDVYSLGVVLFHMLTNEYPFDDRKPMRILDMHFHSKVPSAHSLNPKLPLAIDDVIAQAMAKKPIDRYQSARQFADAFLEALADEHPIQRVALSDSQPLDGNTMIAPLAPKRVNCKITILNGQFADQEHILRDDILTVGYTTDDGNHLGIGDDYASSFHGKFEAHDNGWVYIDLDSTNGTHLIKPDNSKVRIQPHEPYLLRFGDVLEIGNTLLKFDTQTG